MLAKCYRRRRRAWWMEKICPVGLAHVPRRRWESVKGRVLFSVYLRSLSSTAFRDIRHALHDSIVCSRRGSLTRSLVVGLFDAGRGVTKTSSQVSSTTINRETPLPNATRPARRTRRTDHRWRPEEWARIAAYASECGISVSEYVRRAALRATPHGRRRAHQAWAVYELGRIATDLRRLLRSMTPKGDDNQVVLLTAVYQATLDAIARL